MHHNTRSVSRNGNQGSSSHSQLHAGACSRGVGRAFENAASLGAGAPSAPRFRTEAPSLHTRPNLGGQRSPAGFFGIYFVGDADQPRVPAHSSPAAVLAERSYTGEGARSVINTASEAVRPAQAKAVAPASASRQVAVTQPHRPRLADEFDGYGLGRPSTAAMRAAAHASDTQDAADWHALADLAATPQWDHAAGEDRVEAAIN